MVREQGGYGGHDARLVEISVYDHAAPITELERLYGIHRLTYFKSRPEDLLVIDVELARELQSLLRSLGFYQGPVDGRFGAQCRRALHDFMGWENCDERIRDDGRIDREVLADIRARHGVRV